MKIEDNMEKITIYCENDTKEYIFERGATLKEVRDTIFPQGGAFLAALVDNMLKELEIKRRERVQNLENGTEASAEE